ncbi:hypothetical protein JCM33374_g6168 [Metschnikowia sp. JCM 33374]|nr:hypothetical protein JCM33374_g6168 [Metschnikowia sp. JCM 33374]
MDKLTLGESQTSLYGPKAELNCTSKPLSTSTSWLSFSQATSNWMILWNRHNRDDLSLYSGASEEGGVFKSRQQPL